MYYEKTDYRAEQNKDSNITNPSGEIIIRIIIAKSSNNSNYFVKKFFNV